MILDSGRIEIGRETGALRRNGEPVKVSDDEILKEALMIGVLCNNASLQKGNENRDDKGIGDPMEIALLVAGHTGGIHQKDLVEKLPEIREEAFDSEVKMMATFHKENNHCRVAVKGASEAVLDVCSSIRTNEGERELNDGERQEWFDRNKKMAEEGLRVLAVATKTVDSVDAKPYEHLTLLGLSGLLDPPRKDVQQAIALCRDAGIRVVMVTGDQPATARNVAFAVRLIDEDKAEVIEGKDLRNPNELSREDQGRLLNALIFARVSPKQKLDLITLHQKNNSIVAMTGDGVNDAPALKKADIGVAMGRRGTQVARETADMVLKDDAFSTIVVAVEQGRVIFNNIRKFVLYLLSCNLSEVMVVGIASSVNAPLPVLPLQILFLNLVTDVFPALALGVGEGDPGIMKYRPRNPKESILTKDHWLAVGGYGILITTAVLGALFLADKWLGGGRERAVTVSFLTLAFAQLWHVFNMRDSGSGLLRNAITRNFYIWAALALCAGLLLVAVYLPGLSQVLRVVDPGPEGWTLIILISLVPLITGQMLKWVGFLKA
jgi:Ca2+-transporting ATPase